MHRHLTLLLLLATYACGLPSIIVSGNLFFNAETGEQWWAKGVTYQPKEPNSIHHDVLADQTTFDRDYPYLRDLGINVIRVYEVYAGEDHDYAMQKLEEAGIYVLLDLPASLPGQSIDTNNPTWNEDLFNLFKAKIDAFSGYSNMLGYVASNEVSNQANNTAASAFVKAAVRDVKAYLKSKSLTNPVGYAIADAGDIVEDQQAFFACGTPEERVDFYGVNIYRWCGNRTFDNSGWNTFTAGFENWPVAITLTEYGCNLVRPRYWTETLALYSSNMTSVISGGFAFEYSQEENNYGLVNIAEDNTITDIDYQYYQARLAEVAPTGTTLSTYDYNPITVTCPPVVIGKWEAASNPLPPAINPEYCSCVLQSLTCRANADSAAGVINQTNTVVAVYGSVCGQAGLCDDVAVNGRTGSYGGMSMCDALVRVSVVMNNYYTSRTNPTAENCDFSGFGRIQTPSTTLAQCRTTFSVSSSTVATSTSSSTSPSDTTGSTTPTSGGSTSTSTGPNGSTSRTGTSSSAEVTGTSSVLGIDSDASALLISSSLLIGAFLVL